jgi:hypothetical protein
MPVMQEFSCFLHHLDQARSTFYVVRARSAKLVACGQREINKQNEE